MKFAREFVPNHRTSHSVKGHCLSAVQPKLVITKDRIYDTYSKGDINSINMSSLLAKAHKRPHIYRPRKLRLEMMLFPAQKMNKRNTRDIHG